MIKVKDIAYVRFSAPDLDEMERFLVDFGLQRAERRDDRLFMRGTGPDPFVHETVQGEAGFAALAFDAGSAEALEAAAQLEGASAIEDIDGPGGGRCVRFTDPDGYTVEIVHGRAPSDPIVPHHGEPLNTGTAQPRQGTLQRLAAGPSQVKRIGHCVIRVSDFEKSQAWYQSRFGFLVSDEIALPDSDRIVTAFMRCDLGEDFADHHTLLCVGLGPVGFDHAAFEVEDFDDLMLGHDQLERGGYGHHAGVGRHLLGSQIFDYWKDPWGHVLEHFTDGDLLNATHKPTRVGPAEALGTQWGKFG